MADSSLGDDRRGREETIVTLDSNALAHAEPKR